MSRVYLNTEIETETENTEIDLAAVAQSVCEQVLAAEHCPYDVEVSLTVTGPEEIRQLNREFRGIDRVTDVLSFPGLDYETPGDFSCVEDHAADYMDPETEALVFGDIVINWQRVREQAAEYGHSERREFAFLVAHSMCHLCGYDHMSEDEAREMEEKQEAALQALGITRD